MAEKVVLVGVIPEAVVIGPDDQVSWMAGESLLKVEFDPNRCPFSSNMFQAPPGMRLLSGTPRPGTKPGLVQIPSVAERSARRNRRDHPARKIRLPNAAREGGSTQA